MLSRLSRKQLVIIAASAIGVVALVIAAVLIGGSIQHERDVAEYRTAVAAYAEARETLDSAVAEHEDLIESEAAEGVDVGPLQEQIDAASTLEPLTMASDPGSLDGTALHAAIEAVRTATAKAAAATTALDAAGDAVTTAVEAKLRSAALDALDAQITKARKILTKSEGRVDDPSLREDLKARIVDAEAAVADASADSTALDAARTALEDQIALVASHIAPAFSDINGKWCLWNDGGVCMTVDLPHADQGHGTLAITGGSGGSATKCYTGTIGTPGDPNDSAGIWYCPSGSKVPPGWVSDFDNSKYDRIFVSQYNGGSPYFRANERAAATK